MYTYKWTIIIDFRARKFELLRYATGATLNLTSLSFRKHAQMPYILFERKMRQLAELRPRTIVIGAFCLRHHAICVASTRAKAPATAFR